MRWGFMVMALACMVVNVVLERAVHRRTWRWALLPVTLYAFGWSLMTPLVTLMLLDLAPQRRGMASSLQAGHRCGYQRAWSRAWCRRR